MSAGQVDYLDNAQAGRVGDGDLAVDGREIDVAVVDQAVVQPFQTNVDAPRRIDQ